MSQFPWAVSWQTERALTLPHPRRYQIKDAEITDEVIQWAVRSPSNCSHDLAGPAGRSAGPGRPLRRRPGRALMPHCAQFSAYGLFDERCMEEMDPFQMQEVLCEAAPNGRKDVSDAEVLEMMKLLGKVDHQDARINFREFVTMYAPTPTPRARRAPSPSPHAAG